MKILLAGGSGQIGSLLARALSGEGEEIIVLSRSQVPAKASLPWRVVPWDGVTVQDSWAAELEGAGAVINLAGRSVNCRYTLANRKVIRDSRVDSTHAIGAAIAGCARPPAVWLQSSTATIYAHRYDAPNDERTGIIGGSELGVPETWNFSVGVATAWEEALNAIPTPHTRKVALRSAMVMTPDAGGVFDVLLGLVRRGLGGQQGNGRQYVSWIHGDDFVRAIRYLLAREALEGPVNLAAPNPLPNAEFMRALRKAARVPFGLPAADWMLEIGAVYLQTETELILKSRRVVPTRLREDGFTFDFPTWPEAAQDLYSRWQKSR